jgi:hypothetical protein
LIFRILHKFDLIQKDTDLTMYLTVCSPHLADTRVFTIVRLIVLDCQIHSYLTITDMCL